MAAQKFTSVDEYIALQPESIRPTLEKLRDTIKKAAPDSEEKISYQIPYYHYHGRLAYFASFKNHYSLYVMSRTMQAFKKDLKGFKTSKAAINFPVGTKFPVQLVTRMVKWGAKTNLQKEKEKTKE